jgi:hypothetical protein
LESPIDPFTNSALNSTTKLEGAQLTGREPGGRRRQRGGKLVTRQFLSMGLRRMRIAHRGRSLSPARVCHITSARPDRDGISRFPSNRMPGQSCARIANSSRAPVNREASTEALPPIVPPSFAGIPRRSPGMEGNRSGSWRSRRDVRRPIVERTRRFVNASPRTPPVRAAHSRATRTLGCREPTDFLTHISGLMGF